MARGSRQIRRRHRSTPLVHASSSSSVSLSPNSMTSFSHFQQEACRSMNEVNIFRYHSFSLLRNDSLCNRCSCCPCAMTTALRTTKQKAINSARPPIVRRFTKPAIFLVQHEFVAFSHVLFLLFFRSFFQIPSSKLTKMILNIVSSSLTKIVLLCSTAGFI